MPAMYKPFEDINAEPEVIFTCCLLCGEALRPLEKREGICLLCTVDAEETPLPFLVTEAGRAHIAVAKALDAQRDEFDESQEGGTGRGYSEVCRRLRLAMAAFQEVTGNDFFHND